jgi:hypothetical protein
MKERKKVYIEGTMIVRESQKETKERKSPIFMSHLTKGQKYAKKETK